jgi:hypothetical protein
VWGCGACAVWRFASRVQLELRLEAEPRTSELIQKFGVLYCFLLSFIGFSLWFLILGVYFVVVGCVVLLMLEVCF